MTQDFFTFATLGTLTGATVATVVVGNTLQSVFNLSAKWISFAVAQAIVLLATIFTQAAEVSSYFLAVLNGCLVYASAVGLNTMTSTPPPSQPATPATRPAARPAGEAGAPPRRAGVRHDFFSRWW